MPCSPMDEPHEILFGHVEIAVANIVARDFDEIFLERMDHAASDHCCPYQRSAEVANRIFVLCRRLTEEICRYERYDKLCRQAEEDQAGEENEDALSF